MAYSIHTSKPLNCSEKKGDETDEARLVVVFEIDAAVVPLCRLSLDVDIFSETDKARFVVVFEIDVSLDVVLKP